MPADPPATSQDETAPASAAEVPPPTAAAELPQAAASCQNCEAPLTGPYCAQCGQRADVRVPTVAEVGHDIFHSLLHLDGRAWRTLRSLVFRPGELTREFIGGRRQRYLPPFRLYLVISLAFFAISSLLPDGEFVQVAGDADRVIAPVVVGSHDGSEQTAAGEPDPAAPPASGGSAGTIRRGMVAVNAPSSCSLATGIAWLDGLLAEACRKLEADGGQRLGQVFLGNAPKLMFLFLPLMAAVTALFYWSPRRRYVEHLVLYLHTHSLMFLALTAGSLVGALERSGVPGGSLLGVLTLLMVAYVPYYVFRAMRVVYGNGRALTFVKFAALGTIYFVLLGVTLLAGIVYSLLSL